MLGDTYELVDQRATTKDRVVIDLYLACYLSSVAEDHVIAEDTVVGDVGVGHQQAVAPDDGTATGGCTPIDRRTLPYRGVITDDS